MNFISFFYFCLFLLHLFGYRKRNGAPKPNILENLVFELRNSSLSLKNMADNWANSKNFNLIELIHFYEKHENLTVRIKNALGELKKQCHIKRGKGCK